MIRVTHIINDLETGGAEVMLYRLLTCLDRRSFQSDVISLTEAGPIGLGLEESGIPVRALRMRRKNPSPFSVFKLASWLRRNKPRVIQTWMYHADLVGGVAARLAGVKAIAWGIRMSNLDPVQSKRSSVVTRKACAALSHWLPSRIVCCAEAARRVHAEVGYAAEKLVVIPNGFDLSTFRPDGEARKSIRLALGIPAETLVIGLFGRFHPQKDHGTFIGAAGILRASRPDVQFVLCGEGISPENSLLMRWVESVGLKTSCHLLGRRGDMSQLTAAIDIACSSSAYGEGFPNVIGEAMACGVPCVVTDVGDSASLVADTGRVVPARNPEELARAWLQLIELGPQGLANLGTLARSRIAASYSLRRIVPQYEALYRELATEAKARSAIS